VAVDVLAPVLDRPRSLNLHRGDPPARRCSSSSLADRSARGRSASVATNMMKVAHTRSARRRGQYSRLAAVLIVQAAQRRTPDRDASR
jgi:hypothetical protein